MKKNYSFMIIIFLIMFLSFNFNVKANTISSLSYSQIGLNNMYTINANTWNVDLTLSPHWNSWGDSTFIFSFTQQCLDVYGNNVCISQGVLPPIVGVQIVSNDQAYACDIGTTTSYTDNTIVYNTYTAVCRGNIGSNGLNRIVINTQYVPYVWVLHFGSFFTMINNSDGDNTDLVNAIRANNSSQALSEIQGAIWNSTGTINNTIDAGNQQAHQDAQAINDSINNSNIDNSSASSSASTWDSKNASNGTITSLLTLPISLLTALVNGIQTTCSTFNLGTLWGVNLEMPCINIGSLIGNALWTTIDILFSGFMIFIISKKLIKIFNDFTNLKSNQIDELYGGGN